MATLLLQAAGGAIGGMFGPIGAIIGKGLGTLAGGLADRMIVNALTPATRQSGPRLTSTDIQTSTEGSVIDQVRGRARVTGQVIWATRFEEEVSEEKSGGKGMTPKSVTTTYAYFGNFALGLCTGPIAGIGRIWADGDEIDQTLYEIRVYRGTETQVADPLIEAKEGEAPAYRGLAYIVFEHLALDTWGNRLPQISVEIFRPVGDLEKLIQGAALIGGNEFGYDPEPVRRDDEDGGEDLNRHTLERASNWIASIDRLQILAPNISSVMLIVPWFGDDLRCGSCTVRPKVDAGVKLTKPYRWQVGPLTRDAALVVTYLDDTPAYGGTVAATVAKPEVDANPAAVTPIAAVVTKQIAPLVLNATNNEPWYQSGVTVGNYVAMLSVVAGPIIGRSFSPDEQTMITTLVTGLGVVIGAEGRPCFLQSAANARHAVRRLSSWRRRPEPWNRGNSAAQAPAGRS